MTAPPTRKPVAPPPPPGSDTGDNEEDMVDKDTLELAIEVTDQLEADDPDGAAAVRKLCMAEATGLGLGELIPETWNTDGSVGDPTPDDDPPPAPPPPGRGAGK